MKAKCGTCGRKTTKSFAKEYWYVIQSFYIFFFLNWMKEEWFCNGCMQTMRER